MDLASLLRNLSIGAIPIVFAITLHEVAHGWVARYSEIVSWVKFDGHSVAVSLASTSFSRTPCGATAQPTRRPAAMVLENVPR